ncbi:hypothetical protein C0993_009539 [Termitomyces sp. T159_Od127]|nr:hypothetical protein C0993_009539 [Termitomyces sp. T159_Od127]
MALGFLGLVHHLLGELDKAIVKYHEALSIDPINPHVLELLNMALEASIIKVPVILENTEFNKTMVSLKEKYRRLKEPEHKGKDKAPRDVPSDVGPDGDEMNLG